jgi:alkylhydroperoxidase family enzyme
VLEIGSSDYLDSGHFSPRERAAILWAEHMAKNTARRRDDVFEEVKQYFTDAEFVELTGVCGYFGANNRFQDSMRLPIEAQGEVDKIKVSVRADPDRIKAYIEQIVKNWPREFPEPRQDTSTRPTAASKAAYDSAGKAAKIASGAGRPTSSDPRIMLLDPQSAQGETALFFRNSELLLEAVPNAIRVWAHSPYIAKLLLPQIVALQREGAGSLLPITLKSMVRIRTSHLHTAPYSLAHGTALARAAGVTEDQLAALATEDYVNSPHFSARESAALVWAEHVAPNAAKRREDIFEALKQYFSDAEIVELTGLCAVSSQLDLIQNALRVPLEPTHEIARINRSVRLDPQRLKTYLEALLVNWPREFPVLAA